MPKYQAYLPLPAGQTCLMDLLPLNGQSARVVPHKLDHGSGSGNAVGVGAEKMWQWADPYGAAVERWNLFGPLLMSVSLPER